MAEDFDMDKFEENLAKDVKNFEHEELAEKLKGFINSVTVKSKVKCNRPFVISSPFKVLSKFSKSKDVNIQKIKEILENLETKTIIDDLIILRAFENFKIFSNHVLSQLSNKELEGLLDLISAINMLNSIESESDNVKQLIQETMDRCTQLLENVGDYVAQISAYALFNPEALDNFNTLFANGQINGIIPTENDYEVASVLKMLGVDISFNGTEWEISDEGFKSDYIPNVNGNPFSFPRKNVELLLSDYLNKPVSQRGNKIVDPNKLLQVYLETYESQISREGMSDAEKALIKDEMSKQKRVFTTDSLEFRVTKLLDTDVIMRNAQKLALAQVFKDFALDDEGPRQFADEVFKEITSIQTNTILSNKKMKLGKRLGILSSIFDNTLDRYENLMEEGYSEQEDYLSQYDSLVTELERLPHKDEDLIERVKETKKAFETRIQQLKSYITSEILSNDFLSNDKKLEEVLGEIISASYGADLESVAVTDDDILDLDDEGSSDARKEKPLGGSGNMKGNEVWSDIFWDYFNANSISIGENGEELDNEEGFRDFEILKNFAHTYYVDRRLRDKFEDKRRNGYDKNYLDFLKETKADYERKNPGKENPVLDDLIDFNTNPNSVIAQQKSLFEKHLIIMDMVLEDIAKEGKMAEYEAMSDEAKEVFLRDRIEDAKVKYEKLDKSSQEYEKRLEVAKKRHQNDSIGRLLDAYTKEYKDENPEYVPDVKKFIKELLNKQEKVNEELSKNNIPVVELSSESEKTNGEGKTNGKDEEIPTYGDLYPSPPSQKKFLKKLKPYSNKEIVKKFLEPLLEMMEDIKVYPRETANVEETPIPKVDKPKDAPTPIHNETPEEALDEEEIEETLTISQRDFEASAFMPGFIVFSNLARQENYSGPSANIRMVFNYLSSSDPIPESGEKGQVIDGKDFRDALRVIAMNICGNNYKDTESIIKDVREISAKYSLPSYVESHLILGFSYITPEMLSIVLEPVSKLDIDNRQLDVGAGLPIKELIDCKSDRERCDKIINAIDNSKFSEINELMTMMINNIYRENKTIDRVAIQQGFDRIRNHDTAQFTQLNDLFLSQNDLEEDNVM